MGHFFSYVTGILVAAATVFGLQHGLYVSSAAYGRQISAKRASEKSLKELGEMLLRGSRDEKIAALTAIGQGDDELDLRIKLIAATMSTEDATTKSICRLSIQRMGDRAKPTIRALLSSDQSREVCGACGLIRALGTKGDEFSEAVAKLLDEGNPAERHAALYAMQRLSPEKLTGSIDLVIRELDGENFNTQCSACFVLRNMGPAAEPATDRLVQLLKQGNVSTRSRAAEALAAIGIVESHDIPELIGEQLVSAFSYIEKIRLLGAIGQLGPDAIRHVGHVETLMNDRDQKCVAEASLAHFLITGDADRCLKTLVRLLDDKNTRMSAAQALGGMGEHGTDAVPRLMECLRDPNLAIIETAILSLKQIGPTAEEALPRLKKMLSHDDFLITVAAQEAIDAISGKPVK